MTPPAHLTGTHAIQTGGGTFLTCSPKGSKRMDEVEKRFAFQDLGVRQSALIRGDFLFGYDPQPYDVIRELVAVCSHGNECPAEFSWAE